MLILSNNDLSKGYYFSRRFLTLMGDTGDLREDLKLPDGELGTQVKTRRICKFAKSGEDNQYKTRTTCFFKFY